jgi:Flp pilus assembly protein TadB
VSRSFVALALLFFVGSALVLSRLPWLSRVSLTDRLRPHTHGASPANDRRRTPATSFTDLVGTIATTTGEHAARLVGINEPLERRLERVRAGVTSTEFRVRQLAWTVIGFGAGAAVAVALQLPAPLTIATVAGASALAFLIIEQRLAGASEARKRVLGLELAVVAEQLAMLLAAGFPLSGALNRLAARGHGVCREDLQQVCGRMRQGLSEIEALREWAAIADVAPLTSLVGVLALNRHAGDLGRLVSEEARSIRRASHRELIEVIERRAQQVWIPVTVAALVPGAIFVAVPFTEALRAFTTS